MRPDGRTVTWGGGGGGGGWGRPPRASRTDGSGPVGVSRQSSADSEAPGEESLTISSSARKRIVHPRVVNDNPVRGRWATTDRV